jgi:hypothetical protein
MSALKRGSSLAALLWLAAACGSDKTTPMGRRAARICR